MRNSLTGLLRGVRYAAWALTAGRTREQEESLICEQLLDAIDADERKHWLGARRVELIRVHHSYGMWLRNKFLWRAPWVSYDPLHYWFPDQISMRIIERIWETLRERAVLAQGNSVGLPRDDGVRLYHDLGAAWTGLAAGAERV